MNRLKTLCADCRIGFIAQQSRQMLQPANLWPNYYIVVYHRSGRRIDRLAERIALVTKLTVSFIHERKLR